MYIIYYTYIIPAAEALLTESSHEPKLYILRHYWPLLFPIMNAYNIIFALNNAVGQF